MLRIPKLVLEDITVEVSLGRLGGSVGWAAAFGSGHDLRVLGLSPAWGSLLGREPASLSLRLPLCLLVISVCQINK